MIDRYDNPGRWGERWRLAVFLALSVLVLTTMATPCARAAETRASYSFAFRDADIAQVAQEVLGATLGLPYSIDPAATGKMSFRVDRRMTRLQLLEVFELALGANGVVIVRQGDNLLITTRAKAAGATGVRTSEATGGRAGYETVAAPLSFATPSEVAKLLGSMAAPGIVVSVDDKAGIIVLGGSRREIDAALQTIRVFDRSGLEGARMRWFELNQASAMTLAEEINQLLKTSGMTGATVVPLRRLNGLAAFARTPEALNEISRWVDQLDVPVRDQAATLWVYRPRNVSAESLARALAAVLPGAEAPGLQTAAGAAPASSPLTPTPSTSASAVEGAIRIGVDVESNSLLVSAPATQRPQISRVLAEIDVTPTQILIEASILEVTLSDEFRFGVDWSVLSEAGKLRVTSTDGATGTVSATFPGFAVTYIDDDIRAAVDALGGRTAVEVVSSPRIVALNNRAARLKIGDEVPVVVQTSQSATSPDAPRVVDIEYRSTGVILDVTPRVSGDSIILSIAQEVSSVARTTTSGIDSPTIRQRRLESTLLLRDGGVVALGGLISDTRGSGDTGVPYLKDTPFLGALFKNQSRDMRRTELVVLLTARVIRSAEEAGRTTTDLIGDMDEIKNRGLFKP